MLHADAQPVPKPRRLSLLDNECWWGGAVADGQWMPFGRRWHRRDLATSAGLGENDGASANQSAPLLLSSRGRYVWSERPFTFTFDGREALTLDGDGLVVGQEGTTLASAFRAAAGKHFPATGQTPAEEMFTAPQYNTWVEMPHHPTQQGVLDYAQAALDAGFPPGLLMIDDRWSVDYGNWTFDRGAFPDPEEMISELHAMGFRVMVWLVPFVSPDSETYRMLGRNDWLIKNPDRRPVVREWWNGHSAVLDLTHPGAVGWLEDVLNALRSQGVDGFKFDAGDLRDYRPDDVTHEGGGAVRQCEAWAQLGAQFRFNEMRACWKMGAQPLAQRLHDKPSTWGTGGLASLIPEGIAQGLIGHPFNCPDMIGGGDIAYFTEGAPLDQELFVRFAQCSALFPMMQFSLAPWRVLDARHLAAVRAAVQLRQTLLPSLEQLIQHAARTGEPIMRPLAYHFPGYETVRDQFLLGDTLLCAPVLEPAAEHRRVRLPPGSWRDTDGTVTSGPAVLEVDVTLESVPLWQREGG